MGLDGENLLRKRSPVHGRLTKELAFGNSCIYDRGIRVFQTCASSTPSAPYTTGISNNRVSANAEVP